MQVARLDAVGITELGEGPHWHQPTKSLLYVDIAGETVHKYTPGNGKHHKVNVCNEKLGFVVPVAGSSDQFVVGAGRKVIKFTWDGTSDKVSNLEVLVEVDTEGQATANRINDGKCDPSGRLWFGTMGPENEVGKITADMGTLYSLNGNGVLQSHVHPVSISNGLAWSSDGTKFYYIDSFRFCVDAYDFNCSSGTISNRTTIFTFSKHGIEGLPDGMTIDADGNLWVAVFNGSRVLKIDPRRPETLLLTVPIPAKQITSAAFGGDNLDELYVTCAKLKVDGVDLPAPTHGALYKITGCNAKGLPMVDFKC